MPQAILALNAGSSSIKFAAYRVGTGSELTLACKGSLDRHAREAKLIVKDAASTVLQEHTSESVDSSSALTTLLLGRIEPLLGDAELAAVGHRVVHGGPTFSAPVLVDSAVLQALDALTPLAPLHQPGCLDPIRSLISVRPRLLQVACFDTAFHHDLPPTYRRFPLPAEFEADGIRRYGFHGLSFEYIARSLDSVEARVVVAHLGSGSSLCAIRNGKSVNTTMSLTPLDGLMMATRSGAIDPGLVLYLQQTKNMSASEIEELLYHRSGLIGLSGISSDMRILLASDDLKAKEAIDQFCACVAEQIAAMATCMSGVDLLVFTGGIGENSPEIRKQICARLNWLGLRIDDEANMRGHNSISTRESRFAVRVIPTDEESVIAMQTRDIIDRANLEDPNRIAKSPA
ncbi:acetate kinase [Bradyrhizobium sp. AZCC 1678]|uniref:acetate/propionate family kinase n=1 Tax=Bradyrhizobium sp. AZCC 1678 TaxID=3117030 RepID=UPI002FF37705